MITETSPKSLASIALPLSLMVIAACQTHSRGSLVEDVGAAGERSADHRSSPKISATIGDDLSGVIAKDDMPRSPLSLADEEREKPRVSATIGDDLSGTIAKDDSRPARDRTGDKREENDESIAARDAADTAAAGDVDDQRQRGAPALGAVGERTECGLTIVATSPNAAADPCLTTTEFMRSLGYNDAQISSILAIDAGRAVAH